MLSTHASLNPQIAVVPAIVGNILKLALVPFLLFVIVNKVADVRGPLSVQVPSLLRMQMSRRWSELLFVGWASLDLEFYSSMA